MSGYVARVRHDESPGGDVGLEPLVRSAAQRWAACDPLLPEPVGFDLDSYPLLTVSDEDGHTVAAGSMHYTWYQPGEVGRIWGVPDQHWLTPVIGGPEPGRALDSLLTSWRDQLEDLPTGTGSESAALVSWPVRDVCGIIPLQRHGLQPYTVLAARPRRRGVPPSLPPRDVTIRLADRNDLAQVVSLLMEEHRYEQNFGGVFLQPDVCNGCGYCVVGCPFGVVDRRAGDGRAFKCTFCYDRQLAGLQPACAQACPTGSIAFGDLVELRRRGEGRVEALRARGVEDAILYDGRGTAVRGLHADLVAPAEPTAPGV